MAVGTVIREIKRGGTAYRGAATQPKQESEGIITFPFSSPTPARQWFGEEVLSHEPGACNFERINAGACNHLWNHDRDEVLGIVLKGWEGKGRNFCTTQFDLEHEPSREKYDRIMRGFLPNTSFAYSIDDYEERQKESGEYYYLLTAWTPLEVSTVSVPADYTVGHARSAYVERIIWMPTLSQDSLGATQAGTRTMDEDQQTTTANVTAPSPLALTDTERREIAQRARKEEQQRIKDINALETQYRDQHPGIARVAQQGLDEGWDMETTRQRMGEVLLGGTEKPRPISGAGGRVMADDEIPSYSLVRAVQASLTTSSERERRSLAPFEMEVSDRFAKQVGRETSGIFLPVLDLTFNPKRAREGMVLAGEGNRATYLAGTAAQAGNLIETELRDEMLLEYLFNKPIVSQAGATRIGGLTGNFNFPVEDASTLGITWVAEDTPGTQQNTTFTLKGMTPKTASANMRISRQMLLQSPVAMEDYMRSRLGIAMALGVDLAALNGTGAGNQPRGIMQTAGINSVPLGVNGANPNWDAIVKMATLINDANALDTGSLSYVTNARGKGTLQVVPIIPSVVPAGAFVSSRFMWEGNNNQSTINGYSAYCSNQIPKNLTKGTGTNLSALIFGAWNQLMIGQWGVMEIMSNPFGEADFLRGAIQVRVFMTVDIQVGYAQAFSLINDMITQ